MSEKPVPELKKCRRSDCSPKAYDYGKYGLIFCEICTVRVQISGNHETATNWWNEKKGEKNNA